MTNAIDSETYRGYKIDLVYDVDAESPREWDNISELVQLNSRYNNPDSDASLENEIKEAYARYAHLGRDCSAAVEHYLRAYHDVVAFRESGQLVGYITKVMSSFVSSVDTTLTAEMDNYKAWCDGEVYGYVIESLNESCYDYYNTDDALNDARAVVDYEIERVHNERVSMFRQLIDKE